MGIWNDIWTSESKAWTVMTVPRSPASPPTTAAPESGYLSVWIRSWNIPNSRRGFNTFYPAVHSAVSMSHRSGHDATVQCVVSPAQLITAGARVSDRVAGYSRCVYGPTPYIGGRVSFEIGVFSVKESDLAKPFLNVLESMSSAAGVGYFALAKPFIEPIRKAMDDIAGDGNAACLELGSYWQEEPPRVGSRAVIRLPPGAPELTAITVDPENYRLLANNEPLRAAYFMWEFALSSASRIRGFRSSYLSASTSNRSLVAASSSPAWSALKTKSSATSRKRGSSQVAINEIKSYPTCAVWAKSTLTPNRESASVTPKKLSQAVASWISLYLRRSSST